MTRPLAFVVTSIVGAGTGLAQAVPPSAIFGGAFVAEPEGAIRIDSTKTIELCDCENRTIELAITVTTPTATPVVADGEAPAVVEVVRGTARVDASAFSVRWKLVPNSTTPAALVLTVAPTLREQGTYIVVVSLFPTSNPAEPRERISVVVPAAKIEVPARLQVDRTVYWLTGAVAESKSPLVIRETGRASGLLALEGASMPLTAGTSVVAAAIASRAAPVGRDRAAIVEYDIRGDVPLGVTSGSLVLRARELIDAVAVPVEIRSRLATRYLFFAIVAAFIVSWLMKVTLTRHLQLARSRALAQQLRAAVASDRGRYREPEFDATIAKQEQDLLSALRGRDAEAIDAARNALDGRWRTAVQEAETRRVDLRSRARAFDELTRLDWQLPARLRPALDKARTRAEQHLSDSPADTRIENEALQDAQQSFGTAVHELGGEWQRVSRLSWTRVFELGEGLPQSILSAVSAELRSISERFGIPDRLPNRFDAALLERSLRSVAGEYLAMRDIVGVIRRQLQSTMESVGQLLQGEQLPGPARAHEQVVALLDAVVDDPERVEELIDALRALQTAWEQELTGRASAETADTVAGLVRAGKVEEAVRNLSAPSLARSMVVTRTAAPTFTAAVLPALAGTAVAGPLVAVAPRPIFADLQVSLQDLALAKLLQTVATGSLFVLSMTVTQLAKWDGTWPGLAMVFFGVVAVDVTADAVLSRLSGPPRVGAA